MIRKVQRDWARICFWNQQKNFNPSEFSSSLKFILVWTFESRIFQTETDDFRFFSKCQNDFFHVYLVCRDGFSCRLMSLLRVDCNDVFDLFLTVASDFRLLVVSSKIRFVFIVFLKKKVHKLNVVLVNRFDFFLINIKAFKTEPLLKFSNFLHSLLILRLLTPISYIFSIEQSHKNWQNRFRFDL